MAGLSSPGLGSGLDINSLVSQLVAAEKAPAQAQITRSQTSTVTTITALAAFKGALSAFNSALSPLKTVEAFAARGATVSDDDIFTASAASTAAPGRYDVEVERLASAHQISSNAFEDGAGHVVGTGTLTISVGDASFSIGVDDDHDTLAQIRDAINAHPGNGHKVTATIVNANDGAHLVLSGEKTGAANAIVVSQEGGNGGLSRLAYAPANTANYIEPHPAQDAIVYIAGFAHHSASNVVTDAIDGVTLTLKEADDNEVHTLTVANDLVTVTGRARKFVDEFNVLAKKLGELRAYEPTTKKAGPLLGDALLRAVETELRNNVTNTVAGQGEDTYQTLASIGITTQRDGTLSLDAKKLDAALAADFDGVANLFGSEDGVAARLSKALDLRLGNSSELDIRTKRLNQKSIDIQKQQAALEARMLKVEQRYRAQFTALDSMLTRMTSTSNYLAQQLSDIAKIGGG
jgi:flagellar hook-associated protein 2